MPLASQFSDVPDNTNVDVLNSAVEYLTGSKSEIVVYVFEYLPIIFSLFSNDPDEFDNLKILSAVLYFCNIPDDIDCEFILAVIDVNTLFA